MCRLFGFRSVLQSQVHRSLANADNALAVQSQLHPDGWGVAYYVAGAPHIIKGTGSAHQDKLFHRVSGIVTSQTVLAHIRKATQGEINTLNCHPFQYGRWVMAHNGDVPNFAAHREALLAKIAPVYRRFVLGTTDSEIIFHLFLSHLSHELDLHRRGAPVDAVARALRATVAEVQATVAGEASPLLTLMVTDGELMAAHQGGKELHWSTWKRRCAERAECPHFSPECEAETGSGYVNHLVLSSEPLLGENVWMPMAPGEIVAVDHAMRFHRYAPLTAA
ncbi:MAG: class II glutamine amidotransferase [Alphaproteobacteria bacterium]|nr:class II glutamine amidotransferase [Alphaproteobacteria bacterium]